MPAIPRTATGKPLRRLLTEEFVEQAKAATPSQMSTPVTGPGAGSVQSYFQDFFPGQTISSSDSFETMGGDSLSYIQFSLGFEDRFGSLPSGWEAVTVAQLEAATVTQQQQAEISGRSSSWRLLEATTLTRAFFMICIVALHLETFVYSKNWGAAYFLFMLSGYTVMRFQWPEINRTGKVGKLFGTILRVAIPTLLVTVAMQLWARQLEVKPLLLISNLFDSKDYHVAYYYFAEIYMQLLLVIAALLSIPAARRQFRIRPMTSSIVLIVVSMVVSWRVEQSWDTNYLYHRTPIWYLWTVGCGFLMASVRDFQSRVAAMAIVTVAVLMHHGFTSASAYIVGASALLLFWPEIRVPAIVKTVVAEIAGSSMFIYLSHFQIKSVVIRLSGGQMPWLALFLAIGFGIAFAHGYNFVEGRLLTFLRTRTRSGVANVGSA